MSTLSRKIEESIAAQEAAKKTKAKKKTVKRDEADLDTPSL